MSYRDARSAGIEAWRRPQVGSFAVGDIVKPGTRPSYPYRYGTLCYDSDYIVEGIETSKARTRHQILKLSVFRKGRDHQSPLQDGGGSSTNYDARNIVLVRNGDGTIVSDGQLKKNAVWIIVNAADNKVVTSIPLTEPPATESASASEQAKEVYPKDPVRGTADFLSRSQSATIDPALYTEKLVDDKIAELLRKNPEATFMAFKHIKSGKLPVLPVQWINY